MTTLIKDTLRANNLALKEIAASLTPKFNIGELVEVTGHNDSWDGIRLRVLDREIRCERSLLSEPSAWYSYKLGVRIMDDYPDSEKFVFWIEEDSLSKPH